MPSLEVEHGLVTLSIPVEYSRKSKKDYTELSDEKYPKCIIEDKLPELDPEWNDNYKKTYGDFTRDVDGNIIKSYEFKEPLRFIFRYDVSVFTYGSLEKWSINNHFLSKYRKQGSFIFNKTVINTVNYDSEVGDVVAYVLNSSEISRRDGIFEMHYEFELKTHIAITKGTEYETVQQLIINGQ